MAKSKAKAHMGRVADVGCIVCWEQLAQYVPAMVHHIRDGAGLSQRSSDWLTLPLCHNHHQGYDGIHSIGTRAWEGRYGTELSLLAETLNRVYGRY